MYATELLAKLNTEIRDTDNSTFTEAEKLEALNRAIEDPSVCVVEIDSSTLFVNGTLDYTLGADIRGIYRMQLQAVGGGAITPFDNNGFRFISPTLSLDEKYRYSIVTNTIIVLERLRKLSIADDIPDYLIPYVMALASFYTTETLASGKVNRFLKNDVSMAEIQLRNQMSERLANRLRKALPTQRGVAV